MKLEMGKLLELLNEYSELKEERFTEEEGQPIRTRKEVELEYPIEKIRIISKQYGFIEWLVENEKVEWNNKDIAIKEGILGKSIDNYHSLLMALAIQDEPIEFLVSILK